METVQERETIQTEIQTAARHSAVYGLGNVLVKALGFLMLPFYTRYLNPGDYGVLEILDLSMALLGMVLHMGIAPALLRGYAAANSEEEQKTAVSTAFLFVSLSGLCAFLLGMAVIRPASALLLGPKVPATYLLLSFGSFILGYIGSIPRTYLRALEASGTLIMIDTSAVLVMLSLNIYFIAVLKAGLLGILWSSILIGTVQMVVLSVWTVRRAGLRFKGSHLWQMADFGLPLIFSNLAIFALNFSDRFFLQRLRSLEVVGIYAVGYKFAFMINYLLVQPFYVMWQSRMYAIHAQPEHPKIFSRIFVLYSLVLLYVALAISMLSPEIVHVMLGPRFFATQDVIPIVTFSYVLYGVGYYLQLGMFLTNRTKLIGLLSAVAACLNLGLNYILILHYGMLGAAWATFLSFAIIAASSYWFSQRVCPLPLGVGRLGAATALGIGFYALCRWWSPAPLWVALLAKGMLLAAFPILLWKIGILSAGEIDTLITTKDKTLLRVLRVFGLASGKAVNV